MKNSRVNYIILILLIGSIIAFGFYRDFIFKNINALLKAWDNEIDYNVPASLAVIKTFDYSSLIALKWILTILCTAIFMLISLAFIKILFVPKKYIRYTFWSYTMLTGFSFAIIALGYLFKNQHQNFYSISRYLMGMVQSPVLLMILISIFKLSEMQKKEIKKEIPN